MRDTKIVATLGPASTSEEVLRDMIRAGVNVVRINFSHGTAQEHIDRVNIVRKIAEEEGVHIGVLADLQGPKIRISKFEEKSVFLANGSTFVFDKQADVPGDVPGADSSGGTSLASMQGIIWRACPSHSRCPSRCRALP